MSILFEPQRLGRIEIQNRLIRSATYYGLADSDGRVGDASVELMKTLASNAVGLIVTGVVCFHFYFEKNCLTPEHRREFNFDHSPTFDGS